MDLTALLLLEIALIFASKKKPKKIERLPANPNFWARAPFEPISYLATTSSKTLRCRPSFLPSFLRPCRRAASPLPRAATSSVPCRTSTASRHVQSSLPDLNRNHPDLNRDHLRSVFPAGPQLRPSALSQCSLPGLNHDHLRSVSLPDLNHDHLRSVSACSLPDLNRDHLRSVFPAGPQLRPSALSVPCRTSTTTICAQCPCRASTTTICAQSVHVPCRT